MYSRSSESSSVDTGRRDSEYGGILTVPALLTSLCCLLFALACTVAGNVNPMHDAMRTCSVSRSILKPSGPATSMHISRLALS